MSIINSTQVRHASRVTKHGPVAWYLYLLAAGVLARAALMLMHR